MCIFFLLIIKWILFLDVASGFCEIRYEKLAIDRLISLSSSSRSFAKPIIFYRVSRLRRWECAEKNEKKNKKEKKQCLFHACKAVTSPYSLMIRMLPYSIRVFIYRARAVREFNALIENETNLNTCYRKSNERRRTNRKIFIISLTYFSFCLVLLGWHECAFAVGWAQASVMLNVWKELQRCWNWAHC